MAFCDTLTRRTVFVYASRVLRGKRSQSEPPLFPHKAVILCSPIAVGFLCPFGARFVVVAIQDVGEKKANCDPKSPLPKKNKVSTHNQAFRKEYEQDFPAIQASKKGKKHAYCYACNSDFSIAHGGQYDVKKHCARAKHIDNMPRWTDYLEQKQSNLSSWKSSGKTGPEKDRRAISAEVIWVTWLCDNGIAFNER